MYVFALLCGGGAQLSFQAIREGNKQVNSPKRFVH